MLKTYEAVLNNGQLTWLDTPPNLEHRKVRVIILPTTEIQDSERYDPSKKGERRVGALAGKAKFPDDINKYDDEVAKLFGIDF